MDVEAIEIIKGNFGWKDVKPGDDYTHVRLTVEDYESLQREIQRLHSKINDERANAREALQKAVQKAQYDASMQIAAEHEKTAAAERKADSWRNRAMELENKNVNLLRVARQRANADRGLQPKAERSGYLLQSMEQSKKVFFIKSGSRYIKVEKPCWRTRLQTPYNHRFDFDAVQTAVKDDMVNGLYELFGIEKRFLLEDSALTKDQVDELWHREYNFTISSLKFKLNGNKGYWEVEVQSRFSLDLHDDLIEKPAK